MHSPGQPARPALRPLEPLSCCAPRAPAQCPSVCCAPLPVARLPPQRPRPSAYAPAPAYAPQRLPVRLAARPAPCRDTTARLETQAALSPVTILQVVLRYNLASCNPSSHNTVQCIAIHCSLLPSFSIAIHYPMLE